MPRVLAPLLLLACTALWLPREAAAQVRQCIVADGTLVYTDRLCEDIGGSERPAMPPPTAASPGGGIVYRNACSGNVQDLSYALGSAIHSGDVNQLAALYHWVGMSAKTAYQVMDRLDAIAHRPLMDVLPLYSGGGDAYDDGGIVEFDENTGEVVARPRPQPKLIGLRVEQTLQGGHTPARTVFGLRRHQGCWWLTF